MKKAEKDLLEKIFREYISNIESESYRATEILERFFRSIQNRF